MAGETTIIAELARQVKAAVPVLKSIASELHVIGAEVRGLQMAVERSNRQREKFAREVITVLSEAKGGGDEPGSQ